MFVRDYEWYVRHLAEHTNMAQSDVLFVEDVADWCRARGIAETDEALPMRFIPRSGSSGIMVIGEVIPDSVIEERMRAAQVRNQLRNVAVDRTERLNSAARKIAYLFLREFFANSADLAADDLAMEEVVFEQMDRIGVLRP